MKKLIIVLFLTVSLICALNAQERRLKNVRPLTFGGDNAEAYFSPDGSKLTLQVTNPELKANCDQIFMLDLKNLTNSSKDLQLISTGKGRTTCSYFMPDGQHILFASTHEAHENCPEPPKSYKGRYVWAIYPDFDIYVADLKGNIVKKLTNTPGYDAEAVVSPDGKKILFTSMRNGDLDLYTMDIDGSNVKQITHELGYDGGAFFSHDSKKIVFRASRPKTPQAIQEYKELLSQNLVAPTEMEIFICNVDGSNMRQVTHLGKANWAPFFHPSDKKIIFSSNHHSKKGYDFQLFMIDINGENLEQITYQSEFNAFPMFSPDGKKLVFSSNRNQSKPRETNVFIADWVELSEHEIPNQNHLKKHVDYLADDKLEGRLAGSKGETKAAQYIAKQFRSYDIKPLPGTNAYLQPFQYRFTQNPHQTASETDPKVQAKNVVGFINNQREQTIVIGAHYDHLGYNERGHSTAPNEKNAIHNGADDNASGTAVLLELARLLAKNSVQEPVNFLLVAFSGEEDGLQGSKFFADYLIQHQNLVGKPVFMLNMDMVGRLDTNYKFHVHGVGTSEKLEELLSTMKPAGFQLVFDSTGIGPSDHTSFYQKNIPVLFFFTGLHTDYHKPSDDAHKINFYGMKLITNYLYNVVMALAERNEFPFYKTKLKTEKQAAKYKVSLGIMPDYKDYGDGLHVESVIEGRPAHQAGIQDGDIILKIGDCEIKEVYGYMECLSKFQPGDEAVITIKRSQEFKTLKVKF